MFNLFKRKQTNQLTGSEMASLSFSHLVTAIKNNQIELRQCKYSDDIYVHLDEAGGNPRFTYVLFSPTEQNRPIAKLSFILKGIHQNAPLWDLDWAVDPKYQGKNWGTAIVVKALHEFEMGMKSQNLNGFWVEAVIDGDNKASIAIASKLIGGLEIMNSKDRSNVHNFRFRYG